ncbi:MAG: penicillin-binding transpeptidase domain-containing protein [Anaerovoracaceae bacterium]|jgi:peptidoglycan glycosyltransferase
MRKLEKRATICLVLALVLVAGLVYFIGELAKNGSVWASNPTNKSIYSEGYIATGTIYDETGTLLLKNGSKGTLKYNSSSSIREATLHAVGDRTGNIATGAETAFASRLVGYNFISGTYSTNNKGRNLYLTINADVCEAAYEALAGRKGCVGVYNYKTGEIICMTSSPSYDPKTEDGSGYSDSDAVYVNRLLSASFVPGSVFKLVTATAGLETVDNIDTYSVQCNGVWQVGTYSGDRITDLSSHGTVTLKEALAESCNVYFGHLSLKIGNDTLREYTKKAGLMSSYNIDGIRTKRGSFTFPNGSVNLAWAGIGQYEDLVNPCSLMVYSGAIANGGKAANPRIIKTIKYSNGWSTGFHFNTKTDELIDSTTASTLRKYMRNNVTSHYGQENFPNLKIYAKTGTAEVGSGAPNSWFTGFITNDGYPYAFVVLVENGGYGITAAGSVANETLQAVLKTDPVSD